MDASGDECAQMWQRFPTCLKHNIVTAFFCWRIPTLQEMGLFLFSSAELDSIHNIESFCGHLVVALLRLSDANF